MVRSRQSQLKFLCCKKVLPQHVSAHIQRAFLRLTKYHRKVVIYIAFKYCTLSKWRICSQTQLCIFKRMYNLELKIKPTCFGHSWPSSGFIKHLWLLPYRSRDQVLMRRSQHQVLVIYSCCVSSVWVNCQLDRYSITEGLYTGFQLCPGVIECRSASLQGRPGTAVCAWPQWTQSRMCMRSLHIYVVMVPLHSCHEGTHTERYRATPT